MYVIILYVIIGLLFLFLSFPPLSLTQIYHCAITAQTFSYCSLLYSKDFFTPQFFAKLSHLICSQSIFLIFASPIPVHRSYIKKNSLEPSGLDPSLTGFDEILLSVIHLSIELFDCQRNTF